MAILFRFAHNLAQYSFDSYTQMPRICSGSPHSLRSFGALGRNRTYNYPLGRGSYIHLTTRAITIYSQGQSQYHTDQCHRSKIPYLWKQTILFSAAQSLELKHLMKHLLHLISALWHRNTVQAQTCTGSTDTSLQLFSGWCRYKIDPSSPGGVNPNYEIIA